MNRQKISFAINLLAFVAVNAVLGYVYYRYVAGRTSFYDDTFIYLHNAANVAEHFDANYYLPADSHALLSSSPLRLFFLSIAAALAKLWVPLRTLQGAAVVLAVAASLQIAVAGVYWLFSRSSGAAARAWVLLILYWGIGLATHSFFEMEGSIVLIALAALAEAVCRRHAFAMGAFAMVAILARPDLGILGCVFALTAISQRPITSWIRGASLGFAVVAIVYVGLCLATRVYFIPTTVWAKLLSGQSHQFTDERFLTSLPGRMGAVLTGMNYRATLPNIVGGIVLVASAIFAFRILGRRGLFPIVVASLVLYRLPAGFLWYYENILTCCVLLIAIGSVWLARRHRRYLFVPVTSAVMFLAWCTAFAFPSDNLPWNLSKGPSEGSRGVAYANLASLHKGNGIFDLPGFGPSYIRVCEIGMVSFLAGSSVWTNDLCGLAQTGNFERAAKSPLRLLFPKSVQRTGDEELGRFGNTSLPVIDVWARDNADDQVASQRCAYHTALYCMNVYKNPQHR
ncbi:hypothetical protein L2Y94_04020 [Luteibacter aegosomatis]|uniref:hypothetical protein n=1 Tax=Luteibacter aegosomatis TaxID=2911537 RepID=UPI001FF7C8DC|nr:hypothetical protein [Luteibacter aegosomatis]UPG86534.1 hypothetical protein L2Y94_04020 [Luteibacter aegosomatis]